MFFFLFLLFDALLCATNCPDTRKAAFTIDQVADGSVFQIDILTLHSALETRVETTFLGSAAFEIEVEQLFSAGTAGLQPLLSYANGTADNLQLLFDLAAAPQPQLLRSDSPLFDGSAGQPSPTAAALRSLSLSVALALVLLSFASPAAALPLLALAVACAAALSASMAQSSDACVSQFGALVVQVPSSVHRYCIGGQCQCTDGWRGETCRVPANSAVSRRLCDARGENCVCEPGWTGLPLCTTPIVIDAPDVPTAAQCVAGELGCSCVAKQCKLNHGVCAAGVCLCTAAGGNCDVTRCALGEVGCRCLTTGECLGDSIDVSCATISKDDKACVATGEPRDGAGCATHTECSNCANSDGCTWCSAPANNGSDGGLCVGGGECAVSMFAALSVACAESACCPAAPSTPPPATLCESPNYYDTESRACIPCAAGFVPGASQTFCVQCPLGTFRNEMMSECERCLPGTHANPLRTTCFLCAGGQQQAAANGAECVACPAGQVRAADSTAGCGACPSDREPSVDQSECLLSQPGIKFRVLDAASKDFQSTLISVFDEFCIVGGFWIRNGELDADDVRDVLLAVTTLKRQRDILWEAYLDVAHDTRSPLRAPTRSTLLVCFAQSLIDVNAWFELQEDGIPRANMRFEESANSAGVAPMFADVAEFLKGSSSPALLPASSTGERKCLLGGVLSRNAQLDAEQPVDFGVRIDGESVHFSMPSVEDSTDLFVGYTCVREDSALSPLITVLPKVATPCGRGGVALSAMYTASSHACTVHGFGLQTKLDGETRGQVDADFMHAFTYRVGNQWRVAVAMKSEPEALCDAWAQVVCWKIDSFQVDSNIYSIQFENNWLEP